MAVAVVWIVLSIGPGLRGHGVVAGHPLSRQAGMTVVDPGVHHGDVDTVTRDIGLLPG